ncbi:MAG: sensor histidine kinase KdpD [Anaerolineae bacterium]|nr:sensor histidine kinase KdpD [Anaerolineae bacterium]
MTDKRPDPDQLLSQVQQAEAEAKRGRLKIFLGYAAGVGKTFAMLEAARQRRAEGRDVVVGYVETHGRAETDAFLTDLEIIPRRQVSYRHITLSEMDTDAVLARRPQIALVDELAHTNAPGSRHARRFQDVLELVNAGIDVYTTVNIQHLESLNDIVAQITGVVVHETVPDYVLDEATEIELIDLPIDELRQRLENGKVYMPEQAERAMRKFFRPGNLAALREMALRRAAERVDEQMRAYMQVHAIPGPWPAGERILVCVSPSPLSERLVRTARRLAKSLNAEWIAAYVETAAHTHMPEADRDRVARTLRLAEELGAQTVRINGREIAETLVTYAQQHNVTKIVAGKPLRSRWSEWRGGSLIDQILRQSQEIDVYVISGTAGPATAVSRPLAAPSPLHWQQYGSAAILVGLATLLGLPLRPYIEPTNVVMLYLLVVIVTAVQLGRNPAIFASVLGVIAFDLIFVPPYYTFVVADAEYILTFITFLAVSLVISTLTARAREQELAARRRAAQTAALYALSQKLASVNQAPDIAQVAVQHIQESIGRAAGLFLPTGDGERLTLLASTSGFQLEKDSMAVVDWVYRHNQPAGRYTDTLTAVHATYLPLSSAGQVVGVMPIYFTDADPPLTGEQRRLLESFASQVALALERAQLAEQARQTRLLEETEKLQNALLNSISHDLRTPLATITGALSSLHDDADLLSEEARREMVLTAWEEARRLNRLVGNLLDITRLESGAMRVMRHPVEAPELVAAALAQMPHRLEGRLLELAIPDDLPLVLADFSLMVQALVNLIDNALKYAPPDEPVQIEATAQGNEVMIAIKDRGPGLPETERERIFEKFYRAAPPGVGGTGLGLAISKGIVEAHHGRITAQNRPGGGAVFMIWLPVAEAVGVEMGSGD